MANDPITLRKKELVWEFVKRAIDEAKKHDMNIVVSWGNSGNSIRLTSDRILVKHTSEYRARK